MSRKQAPYHVPERFLRQLWKQGQFSTAQLCTTDGRALEILSPGTLNENGGPDFRNARIRIGRIVFVGDVELHQTFEEWNKHQHHLDPKYNSVILHVVFRSPAAAKSMPARSLTKSQRLIPVLVLEPYLSASFRQTWEQMILSERAERLTTIKCYKSNSSVPSATIQRWVEKLAVERIELKVRRFEERLRELVDTQVPAMKEPIPIYDEVPFGINPEDLPPPQPRYSQNDFKKKSLWEQLLYEGIMEALGYSKNQQPFLKLARNVHLGVIEQAALKTQDEPVLMCEAILFAAAGLLPESTAVKEAESKIRLNQLRKLWKEFRSSYHSELLDEAEWQFFRLRPVNFPTVRLAGAARVILTLTTENLFKRIIQTIKDEQRRPEEKLVLFQSWFVVPVDEFWSTHYHFGKHTTTTLKFLIGRSRANDIILNVVIPICLLYARIFKDKEVRQRTLELFERFPPLSDNTITRTIEKQLIRKKFQLNSAMLQQGVIQLYKFYCVEERCNECEVGKVV